MNQQSTAVRVLLVDDEKDFVETVSERLQTRGFQSEVAYSGEEALLAIEKQQIDVVVLDLKMPGMDGLETLRRIKGRYPKIEVIMLTGHGTSNEKKLAEEFGVFAYFSKPQDLDMMAKTIKEAWVTANHSSSA